MFDADLVERAQALIAACRAADVTIATAESCTGGLLAALLTEIAGSSAVVERGFVTYSNDAKHDMLGVPLEMIARHGAVSPQTALAMVEGVLSHSNAIIGVSITGIAGPGGGTAAKPVGLVHFGVAKRRGAARTDVCLFGDIGRQGVRLAALRQAMSLLESAVRGDQAGP